MLGMASGPDRVAVHDMAECGGCGHRPTREADGHDTRQDLDIPPIKVEVAGHRRAAQDLFELRQVQQGGFPKGLSMSVRSHPIFHNTRRQPCSGLGLLAEVWELGLL